MDNHTEHEGDSQSPSVDSEPPKALSESQPTKNPLGPLSESLRASLSELPDDALSILGPELFDQANKELNRTAKSREANSQSGVIFNVIDSRMRFLYRDKKSRARHMFQNFFGLVYPTSKSDPDKRCLGQAFEDGWESGDLEFLARVQSEDLGLHRYVLSNNGADGFEKPCGPHCTEIVKSQTERDM